MKVAPKARAKGMAKGMKATFKAKSGGRAGYKGGRKVGGGKSMGGLPTPIRLSLVNQKKEELKRTIIMAVKPLE